MDRDREGRTVVRRGTALIPQCHFNQTIHDSTHEMNICHHHLISMTHLYLETDEMSSFNPPRPLSVLVLNRNLNLNPSINLITINNNNKLQLLLPLQMKISSVYLEVIQMRIVMTMFHFREQALEESDKDRIEIKILY